jgi:hypothetical protein
MKGENFSGALRAELDAVVARYEAMARAHHEALAAAGKGEADALRTEAARLSAEVERLRAAEAEQRAEAAKQRARADDLARDLAEARARTQKLEAEAKVAIAEAKVALEEKEAYEEQFTAERKFVEACRGIEGSLLAEALAEVVGQPIAASSVVFAALKAKGLEVTLVSVIKDRGRGALTAPLLERERAALSAMAAAAGCELIVPAAGTRFSTMSMEKASTVTDPAEEGNVVDCAMPGCRRAGTDGALVFPRVVVASG